MLADLGRLILLILLLPLILILIGPFLIVAVIRGRQPLGPITLDTSRYSLGGRAGAFSLGLLLWLLVWGGLAWFAINAFSFPTALITGPPTEPATTPVVELATPTPLPPTATPTEITESAAATPTAPPIVSAETPTPLEPTATLAPTHTPILQPDSTSTLTPTPSPKTPAGEVDATPTPTSGQTDAGSTATATVSAGVTLSLSDRQAVVAVVETGNDLLRETIALANETNMQNMETVWRGLALQVAKNFATDLYQRYAKPLEVQFEYIEPPVVEQQTSPDEVVVTSREKWTYGGPTKIDHEEAFEFIYTLNREAGKWVITRYTYRNLPVPIPTPTSEKQP